VPYELGITEVGPAEYPLLEVLRETIFGAYGHQSLSGFAEILEGRRDVLAVIAHLEGNPIGFKVGCGSEQPGVYHSRSGGVLKEYRRLGLGRRMQDWQHQYARSRGYRQVVFNTFNHFPDMVLFGLVSGFEPVGAEWRDPPGAMSIKFRKELGREATAIVPVEVEAGELAQAVVEVDSKDVGRLHALVSAGFGLVGFRHDRKGGRAMVMLEGPRA
jgi:GNAT superfamily N-acetyltransferase